MTKISLSTTDDQSHTLYNDAVGEHYHSTFGAIRESDHVFIQSGLDLFKERNSVVNIFEVGFGTGLNALLALKWTMEFKVPVFYQSIELHPVSIEQAKLLNYPELINLSKDVFLNMHSKAQGETKLTESFCLQKKTDSLQNVDLPADFFNLIFFDAFSPDVQPEMWTEEIFQKIGRSMKRGGVLTTYSCKGIVKRALKSAGFDIEKLSGPPGKREILRAFKK